MRERWCNCHGVPLVKCLEQKISASQDRLIAAALKVKSLKLESQERTWPH